MKTQLRSLSLTVISFIFIAGSGCGGDAKTNKPVEKSPLQYFRDELGGAMMTHGRILADSIEENNGRIQYKTEDGKKWRVSYRKLPDGNYKYDTPDDITDGK